MFTKKVGYGRDDPYRSVGFLQSRLVVSRFNYGLSDPKLLIGNFDSRPIQVERFRKSWKSSFLAEFIHESFAEICARLPRPNLLSALLGLCPPC
jgi:hypothetical protein